MDIKTKNQFKQALEDIQVLKDTVDMMAKEILKLKPKVGRPKGAKNKRHRSRSQSLREIPSDSDQKPSVTNH